MSKAYLICFAILAMSVFSFVNADDAIKTKILELFPQADTNGDGVISAAEEAVVSRQALKRYPQADKNGDGALSEGEKEALLRQAAKRAQKNNPNPSKSKTDKAKKKPTRANVKYGKHERQVFDIWLADSSKPTPLAIYIHGGGFRSGSKEKLKSDQLSELLESGISVAAINYRYRTIAPLPAAHHDARRALQFMRSKAGDWNIDKNKVATLWWFRWCSNLHVAGLHRRHGEARQCRPDRTRINSTDLRGDDGRPDSQQR